MPPGGQINRMGRGIPTTSQRATTWPPVAELGQGAAVRVRAAPEHPCRRAAPLSTGWHWQAGSGDKRPGL